MGGLKGVWGVSEFVLLSLRSVLVLVMFEIGELMLIPESLRELTLSVDDDEAGFAAQLLLVVELL